MEAHDSCILHSRSHSTGSLPLDTDSLRAIVCAEDTGPVERRCDPEEGIAAREHGIAGGSVQGGNPVPRAVGGYPIHSILKIAVSSYQLFGHRSSCVRSE